ncbi:hypothetical protein ACPVPU_12605 [Sphingomonas sp. CJ99]
MKPPHLIAVTPEPFGYGFDVTVNPPPQGIGHDREFRAYADARAYADQLSKAMGWPVIDQAGDHG